MSSADDPTTKAPAAPTAAERAAAEALAAAIDGPELPAGVDPEALGAATLLAAYDEFELSDDRFAAVAERIGAAVEAPAPRRRWRWLFVVAPALAAAGLMFVVLPSMMMMSADEPAPAPEMASADAPAAAERPAPARVAVPVFAAEPIAPEPTLVALQRRVIDGEDDAVATYEAALAAHRGRMLAAMGAGR